MKLAEAEKLLKRNGGWCIRRKCWPDEWLCREIYEKEDGTEYMKIGGIPDQKLSRASRDATDWERSPR